MTKTSDVKQNLVSFIDSLQTAGNTAGNITAGELRDLGFDIPADVPDCGWVPRSSLKWSSSVPEHSDADVKDGLLKLDVLTFTKPFRWLQVTVFVPQQS